MRYDSDGAPVWASPIAVESANTSLPYSNIGELAGLSDGSFIVLLHTKATSWTINSTMDALKFDADGNEIWRIEAFSNQTMASNRRYPILQYGDVVYFGYYGSTGYRFDSFLQRINPDGTLPWGVDGIDFSTDDTFYEMTTTIAFEPGSDYIWAAANVCNDTQSVYGQFVQKFNKETGERQLGDNAKEIFPVSSNWISVGDLQLVDSQPLFLFSNDISNGVNPIQLGVVLLDADGNFVWPEEYKMIATSEGNKFRNDFTKNVNGQSVAIWSENRDGGNFAYAQNIVVEGDTQSVNDLDKSKVIVYPNPTNGIVTIQSDQPVSKIEIIDFAGNLVLKKLNSKSIDLQKLPNGVYLIKTTLKDNSVKINKIVKK